MVSPEEIKVMNYGKTDFIKQSPFRGHFDDNSPSHGARGVIRKLRQRQRSWKIEQPSTS